MCKGFVLGGSLKLLKPRTLAGAKVQMPIGGEMPAHHSRGVLEFKHYCDVSASQSVGADFYVLHVDGPATERGKDEAIQVVRDLKLRPAGICENFTLIHSDYADICSAIATAESTPRVRGVQNVPKPIPSKICSFCLGGRLISHGVKFNPFMVREETTPPKVVFKGSVSEKIRKGWYIFVTDHRVSCWK